MDMMKHIIILAVICPALITIGFAQRETRPTFAWYLPGVSYKHSPSLRFTAQVGVATPQPTNAIWLQSYIRAGKYITLNPAYLYLRSAPSNGTRLHEHTLMNSVIINVPLKNFLIDDRNMVWNRFRQHADNIHFYRNRLRVGYSFAKLPQHPRLYVYDEVFYLFNTGTWVRNRVAAGFACDLFQRFNIDISYVRQAEKGTRGMDIFFIMGFFQLKRRGVE
jgi:hypothetical protein